MMGQLHIHLKGIHLLQLSSGVHSTFLESSYVTVNIFYWFSWRKIDASLSGIFLKMFLIPCP